MVAPSVSLFLHSSTPKTVISVPSLLHSPRSRKWEEQQQQACHRIRGSVLGNSRSCLWFGRSPRANFHARAADNYASCMNAPTASRQAVMGRCALVSAAAALLLQSACGEELAIAATYSPSVGGSHYSSFSGDSLVRCSAAPTSFSFTSSTKKSTRVGGSHAKLSIVTGGVTKQSTVAAGSRKPSLLVKRPGGYLPRLKNDLLTRQVACSPVAVLPIASISAVTLTAPFSAATRLGLALDLSVLRSSFGTSVNLVSLCTLVVWMQRSGQFPGDTPVILSQVAFRLFIPCFLMSKVATTLSESSASNLVALPLMAAAQVFVGATLGKLACRFFFKGPSLQPAVDGAGSDSGDGSSSSLAFTEDQQRINHSETKKQALITAACAFGNSLTLPLVFLSGVLANSEDANRAAGYLALYMVGWSPAMWTYGYKILTAGDPQESEPSSQQSIWQSISKWIGSVMNPPLYGVLVGLLVGGTPLSHLFLGGKEGAVLASTSVPFDTVGAFAKLRAVTSGILSPLFEAASLLGTATLAVQTVVLATSLGAVLPKAGEESKKVSSHEADLEKSQPLGEVGTSISKSETTLDAKAFWLISLVRLILLPFTGILFSFILQCCHLLPPDPIYRLVILAESAMPTAQNLVLLAQLTPGTRPLAGMLADLLLRQYALSIISVTMWMAVFLKITPLT